MTPFPGTAKTIRRKLMSVVLVTTLAALLINGLALIVLELQDYRESQLAAVRTQADILARASAAAVAFNDRKEVYVIGEVLRPQALTFKTTDMTLTQALGRTGGLNPITSKGEAVYVIRGIEEMQQTPATVYQLDAKSPVAFALGDKFRLKPGDVVWVGPAGITRWNRFLSQLLPLSAILTNAAAAQSDITN